MDKNIATEKHQCKSDSAAFSCILWCHEDYEGSDGRFWMGNEICSSQTNYCPFCGMKAPTQIGESTCEECDPCGWVRFPHQHSYIGLHHGPFGVVFSERLNGWYEKCRSCNPDGSISLDGKNST